MRHAGFHWTDDVMNLREDNDVGRQTYDESQISDMTFTCTINSNQSCMLKTFLNVLFCC